MQLSCPICMEQHYAIDLSLSVCPEHEDMLVTICEYCGRACFSTRPGACPTCVLMYEWSENADDVERDGDGGGLCRSQED